MNVKSNSRFIGYCTVALQMSLSSTSKVHKQLKLSLDLRFLHVSPKDRLHNHFKGRYNIVAPTVLLLANLYGGC